jgi:hypothetical protein
LEFSDGLIDVVLVSWALVVVPDDWGRRAWRTDCCRVDFDIVVG